MLLFWLVILVMSLLAASFLFLPALRQGRVEALAGPAAINRDEQVLDLFNEHQQDLAKQLQQQSITQAQFEQLKAELELSLLDDMSEAQTVKTGQAKPWLLWSMSILVPLIALLMYQQRGALADLAILDLQHEKYQQDSLAGREGRAPDLQLALRLRDELVVRLADKPDNLQNHYLLASVAVELEQYTLAVKHFGYIVAADDQAVNIMAEMAQAIFLAADNRITPEVSQWVARVLSIDAAHPTALGLAGIEAYQKSDFVAAQLHWQQALLKMDPASGAAQSLRAGVQQARKLQGNPLVDESVVSESADQLAAEPAAGSTIYLDVSLDPEADVSPEQVVYIYARAWQGAPMPLAIQRVSVADLPLRVALDETMAMAPGMSITSAAQLELIARVSRDGGPRAQAGDWQASKGPVELAGLSGPVALVIGDRLP